MRKLEFKEGQEVKGLIYLREGGHHVSPSRSTRTAFFKCYCGNEFKAIIRSVISGNTKSCGCFGRESRSVRFTKHGMSESKIYKTWVGIKTRCYNKNRSDYKFYGERGISLSDEFHDFKTFYDYVSKLDNFDGVESLGLTLDRVDNNKSYERGNLKWATRKQQAQNRRSRSWLRANIAEE